MHSIFLAVILGLIFLVWSADKFVEGSANLAVNFGVSKFVIGLTVVAFGTSAPEILVSITAALTDSPGIALGNAIGSNIANIGLVLGVTALVAPILLAQNQLRQDLPILVAITLCTGLLLHDYHLSVMDGLVLMLILLAYLIFLVRVKFKTQDNELASDTDSEIEELTASHLTNVRAITQTLIGLLVLILSARALVWGSSEMAKIMGVNETLIGLTLVAVGTSLPELAAALASAFKKHTEMALGNVIGSNIFNMITVLPLPGLFAPGAISNKLFDRDYFVMLSLTLLIIAFAFVGKSRKITAAKGVVILLCYVSYYFVLYQTELRNPAS